MLTAHGITELALLSNNPDKAAQLRDRGIAVNRTVPTGGRATASNLHYLHAKVATSIGIRVITR